VGSSPVTCNPSDQCHLAGTCNPNTGQCSNPQKDDGAICTDNNLCTEGDQCTNGACVPGPQMSCDPGLVCEPALGICLLPI
jgi:hypothetical protein